MLLVRLLLAVEQFDTLIGSLTVHEMLMYTAEVGSHPWMGHLLACDDGRSRILPPLAAQQSGSPGSMCGVRVFVH